MRKQAGSRAPVHSPSFCTLQDFPQGSTGLARKQKTSSEDLPARGGWALPTSCGPISRCGDALTRHPEMGRGVRCGLRMSRKQVTHLGWERPKTHAEIPHGGRDGSKRTPSQRASHGSNLSFAPHTIRWGAPHPRDLRPVLTVSRGREVLHPVGPRLRKGHAAACQAESRSARYFTAIG